MRAHLRAQALAAIVAGMSAAPHIAYAPTDPTAARACIVVEPTHRTGSFRRQWGDRAPIASPVSVSAVAYHSACAHDPRWLSLPDLLADAIAMLVSGGVIRSSQQVREVYAAALPHVRGDLCVTVEGR